MSPSLPRDASGNGNSNSNGERAAVLSKVRRESHSIHKASSSSSSASSSSCSVLQAAGVAAARPRHPVITYTQAPRVIHTSPEDFMALVQKLTGLSRYEDGGDFVVGVERHEGPVGACRGVVLNGRPAPVDGEFSPTPLPAESGVSYLSPFVLAPSSPEAGGGDADSKCASTSAAGCSSLPNSSSELSPDSMLRSDFCITELDCMLEGTTSNADSDISY